MNTAKRVRAVAALIGLVLISIPITATVQDMTVEWKASLSGLERRLPGLPSEGATVDTWRSDAEALRSSIASAAAAYENLDIQLPKYCLSGLRMRNWNRSCAL